jgi:hypothetical protein
MESGRWHASHFSWKIGAISFVNVGFAGTLSAALRKAGAPTPTAETTARTPRGFHILLISELLLPPSPRRPFRDLNADKLT